MFNSFVKSKARYKLSDSGCKFKTEDGGGGTVSLEVVKVSKHFKETSGKIFNVNLFK